MHRFLFRLFRHLPVRLVSFVGSVVVRANVRINRPTILADARRNLLLHRPGLSKREIDRMLSHFLDNVGRMMAEFAILHRLVPQGRIQVVGHERGGERVGRIPTLALALHTGNWEVFSPAMQALGIRISSFYEPPTDIVQREIAESVRRQFGMGLLSPDRRGIREALAVLRQNGIVAIFADEARGGRTMAPLFGRAPHDKGNLAIAARLARHSRAQIVVIHCERLPGVRFRLHCGEPFFLPEVGQGMLEDVALLNAAIEPVILQNLDRWYYLDDSIAPLES